MGRSTTIRKTLLLIVLSPLLFVLFLLVVLWLPFFVLYRILLRLAFEALVTTKGRRIVLVYSRSPVWQEYIERNWLPVLADQAMVLNLSDRASWKGRRSFAASVFRHWAPPDNFNPMAIVFSGFRPATRIGFYYAFRDWKHGKEGPLKDAEKQLFAYLAKVQRPNG